MVLLCRRDPFGRRHAARGVHAHVEGAVLAEAEAAAGVVDLGRRNAQVKQDAVDLMNAARGKRVGHRGKAVVNNAETRIVDLLRGCNGLRVLVERDQAPLGGQARLQQAAVTAATEGPVYIRTGSTCAAQLERIDCFVK